MTRLQDVGDGLKLALRGRVQLRQDLIDFENPRETMRKVDELSEDLVRNALIDLGNEITYAWDRDEVEKEVRSMVGIEPRGLARLYPRSAVLRERLGRDRKYGQREVRPGVGGCRRRGRASRGGAGPKVQEEYLASAAEFMLNLCAGKKWIPRSRGAGRIHPAGDFMGAEDELEIDSTGLHSKVHRGGDAGPTQAYNGGPGTQLPNFLELGGKRRGEHRGANEEGAKNATRYGALCERCMG